MKKVLSVTQYIVTVFILCSCALFPMEDEVLQAPIIRSYEKKEYRLFEATISDIAATKSVSCVYTPSEKRDMSFPIGGELIEKVNAAVGDYVEKGEILAELERGGIVKNLEAVEHTLGLLSLNLQHLEERRALEIKELAGSEKASESEKAYNQQKDTILSELRIANIQKEQLTKENNNRIIVSEISGTVTYVKKTVDGDRSSEGQTFISVADKSSTIFIVDGDDANLLILDEVVSVKIGSDKYYDARVTEIKPSNKNPEKNTAYLQLLEATTEIKENAYGTIKIILEQREQVLCVPSSTIGKVNDKEFVYILDDDVRKIQFVETGLYADGNVEILSGLTKGQLIIQENAY